MVVGNIGYACISDYLRIQSPPVFCSRTLRESTYNVKGFEYVKNLALANLTDLKTIIEWNVEHNIYFMRMTSQLLPFHSHKTLGYKLEDLGMEINLLFAEIGILSKELNHRLTFHPGQFVNLGSPHASVVESSSKDLICHADVLDAMGLDSDSVMTIHLGGVYGDKAAAIVRWEENFLKLPKRVRDRIVIENDDTSFSIADILPTSTKLQIPIVLDYHHHSLRQDPSHTDVEEFMPQITAVWKSRNIKQKVHWSESRKGAETLKERRAHSDRVTHLPSPGVEVSIIIESKHKEQSVFDMYEKYNLFPENAKKREAVRLPVVEETKRVCDRIKNKAFKFKTSIEK